jgi:eukaryotic-like serine/threonine-protein kinase
MTEVVARLGAALSGRYRIERQFGQGGMATVYLAQDLKHNRKVAIKVLKPEIAALLGADRFVQEIQTTAQLQHPHILALFDSGEVDGFLYYVMPYVQGETLREKLDRETQLGIEEAVRLTIEVADALQYAHEQGVIHRDIKPENILLHAGRPMVADFGIALALSAAAGGRLTETGMSLGTPHYMSPEQATAEKTLTNRSDIYSLGCVLYEMLTGNPPHTGSSAQQIIMRIIAEPVAAVTTLRKSVPPNIAAALGQALEKLPADRFESGKAFSDALLDPHFTLRSTAAVAAGEAKETRWKVIAAVAIGALVVGGVVGWLARAPKPTPLPPVVRMYLQGDSTYGITNVCCGPSIAISPDGRRVVFLVQTTQRNGERMYYRRDLDDAQAHPIPGTEGGHTPFLSPDGRWLGFVKDSNLMKTDLSGGAPFAIANVGTQYVWGATWADDGNIYFTRLLDSMPGIYRMSAQGGAPPERVSPADSSVEANRANPAALPGGRALLYVSWPKTGGDKNAWVVVLNLKDGSSHRLTPGIQPYYASGHLVYALADGSIMARPFDLASPAVTGEPVRISDHVITHNLSDTEYAVSRSGTIVTRHTSAGLGGVSTLGGYSMDGAYKGAVDATLPRGTPSFSPDGRWLAFAQSDIPQEKADVWVRDLRTGLETRLSSGGGVALYPVWSADSRNVRWLQSASGVPPWHFISRPVDLSGPAAPFAKGISAAGDVGLPSRTGGPIPYSVTSAKGDNRDLWIMNADGTDPRPFLQTPSNEMEGAVSPSGKWIAYASDENGQLQVWVQPFPRGGARSLVSDGPGAYPVWASDTRLVYLSGNTAVLAQLDVTPEGVHAVGYHSITGGLYTDWDTRPLTVNPAGDQVLVVDAARTGRLLVETNRLQQVQSGASRE